MDTLIKRSCALSSSFWAKCVPLFAFLGQQVNVGRCQPIVENESTANVKFTILTYIRLTCTDMLRKNKKLRLSWKQADELSCQPGLRFKNKP